MKPWLKLKSLLLNGNSEPKNKINSTINKELNDSNEKKNKSNIGKKIKSNKAKIRNKSSNKCDIINKEIKISNVENPLICKGFNYYIEELDINSKFYKKYKSKNYIYFECSKKGTVVLVI